MHLVHMIIVAASQWMRHFRIDLKRKTLAGRMHFLSSILILASFLKVYLMYLLVWNGNVTWLGQPKVEPGSAQQIPVCVWLWVTHKHNTKFTALNIFNINILEKRISNIYKYIYMETECNPNMFIYLNCGMGSHYLFIE